MWQHEHVLALWTYSLLSKSGPEDVFFDVGCGKGDQVIVASVSTGCCAVGIDVLPEYRAIGEGLALASVPQLLRDGVVQFHTCDIRDRGARSEAALATKRPTVVYANIVTRHNPEILQELYSFLLENRETVRACITLMEPLPLDGRRTSFFSSREKLKANVSWGPSPVDVYVYTRDRL